MKKNQNSLAASIKENPNTKIRAEKDQSHGSFSIYLDCSGQMAYVMSHRWNKLLFEELCRGIGYSELKRWSVKQCRNRSSRVINAKKTMLRYLLTVIDEYIDEELAYKELSA